MIVDFNKININLSIKIGLIIWALAMITAMIIMAVMGIDIQDPDLDWGIDHPEYWKFEFILNLVFLGIGTYLLVLYFKRSGVDPLDWKAESITIGIVIMGTQFIMDTIVLVFLFGNGFEYFYGFVTIVYFLMPLWSYIVGWYWRVYQTK
ncbi:MAG: hypothetical protein ACXAD7_06925 [Candidatus Kariarchaeaceae archaeon]|jgi:hypothetical protein